jgi:hypothetical protein
MDGWLHKSTGCRSSRGGSLWSGGGREGITVVSISVRIQWLSGSCGRPSAGQLTGVRATAPCWWPKRGRPHRARLAGGGKPDGETPVRACATGRGGRPLPGVGQHNPRWSSRSRWGGSSHKTQPCQPRCGRRSTVTAYTPAWIPQRILWVMRQRWRCCCIKCSAGRARFQNKT